MVVKNQKSSLAGNGWPFFSEEEIEAASRVLRSGKVNYWTGEEGRKFEEEFAGYIGVKHAVALANGTLAIEAALLSLGITEGDEVIVPCRTYVATATSVLIRGAKPVFADVDLVSQNITVETIRKLITPKTRAVIVVHLAGWPCEMDAISDFCKEKGLLLIEDCAQATGAAFKGKKIGSWGDAAAFSFCQDKILTTAGEGGMLLTNRDEVWDKAWSYKDHGKSFKSVFSDSHGPGYKWVHENIGSNWRLSEVQSAIGRIQLRKLEGWIEKRRQLAHRFNQLFSGCPDLRLTIPDLNFFHSYYKYYVFIIPENLKMSSPRNYILETLNKKGTKVLMGSCPEIYREKVFSKLGYGNLERRPNASLLGETSLMFMVHPTLEIADIERNATELLKVIDEIRK
ncbi:MAG: DegT/DnrJ/EryC1/StrS aminotransferase family protein [Candidatus Riflebacteria bacterium]|nr:DegT/DnrJ/EryC1/StrS aminotransferase family protein [Candidatus Riflebacteria bacterium]